MSDAPTNNDAPGKAAFVLCCALLGIAIYSASHVLALTREIQALRVEVWKLRDEVKAK